MDNKEYAAILEEIATLQRVAGDNFFKVRAFSRAARLVESLTEPLDNLIDGRRLDELAGVGESIDDELQALRVTGSSPRHQELLDRVGRDVMQLWDIQGLGIKRIQTLYQDLGVSSVAALKKAAIEGHLARLEGFGTAVQDRLLLEIEGWERGRGRRFPLPEAKGLADSLRHELLLLSEVQRCEVGGSIRRGKETIGDIDLLVTTSAPAHVAGYFKNLPEVTEVIFDGRSRASVRVTSEIQCDLRLIDPHLFGAGLHYFTGNKDHHIQMRLRSKRLGLKISEKGVIPYDDPDAGPVGPMDTEEQVFAAVGLDYVPPEIRMGREEIQMAEDGTLPSLVTSNEIRGDVHVQSVRSGGHDRAQELVLACRDRGYEWVVLCEHSHSLHSAGLNDSNLREHIDAIRQLDSRIEGIRVLVGIRVEILPHGGLDLSSSLLAECDWVSAVISSDVDPEDAAANTERIIWGLETGLISCLANPTGRRLGVNDGYRTYFEEVVECAKDFGTCLEISGNPKSLDLNGHMAARARELGADLVVSSDAGSVEALSNVEYALQQARRGWLTASDILNTATANELLSRTRKLVQ